MIGSTAEGNKSTGAIKALALIAFFDLAFWAGKLDIVEGDG